MPRCSPAEPIVLGDGRVTLGGDVSATFSCAVDASAPGPCGDDTGFFNYTDYEHSTLRMLQLEASAPSVRANQPLSVLGGGAQRERRARREPYALCTCASARGRSARFDIQAGRVPPTFGAFARRAYAYGQPADRLSAGYQYLTSLRPDALPANADELLRMRGRGWLSSFSLGNPTADRGCRS